MPAIYSSGSELDKLLCRVIRIVSLRNRLELLSQRNKEEALFDKRDSELATIVRNMESLREKSKLDWNGLMSAPDLLMSIVESSKDMREGLFYKSLMDMLGKFG